MRTCMRFILVSLRFCSSSFRSAAQRSGFAMWRLRKRNGSSTSGRGRFAGAKNHSNPTVRRICPTNSLPCTIPRCLDVHQNQMALLLCAAPSCPAATFLCAHLQPVRRHDLASSSFPDLTLQVVFHKSNAMKVSTLSVSAVALASLAALAPQDTNAHGYISQPKASYKPNTIYTNFNAEITASVNAAFAGKIFNHAPEDNAKVFTAAWPQTGYKSLKEMLDPAAPDCGLSLPDVTPIDVSSMKEFKFQNNEYKEGFIASHRGPCELWIGDTRAWHYDDCAAQFPGYPATIPTDFSVCKGTCRVTFYWLALHSPSWQIYSKHCCLVNLERNHAAYSLGSFSLTASMLC